VPLWSETFENKIANFTNVIKKLIFTVCGGKGVFRIRLIAPTKIVKKWGIYTHGGTHKIYFVLCTIQIRGPGKYFLCDTFWGNNCDLKESAKILFDISNNNHRIILNFISEKWHQRKWSLKVL